MSELNKLETYIIDFLARFSVSLSGLVHYGQIEDMPAETKIVIIPVFADFEITGPPEVPFELIDNTPILFGNSKTEKHEDVLIIYADIIASSFFLLSRYEEILKPNSRDQH